MKHCLSQIAYTTLLILCSNMLVAQSTLVKSVVDNGGMKVTDGTNNIYLSIGQSTTGLIDGQEHISYVGFWTPMSETETSIRKTSNRSPDHPLFFSQNYPNPFSESTFFDLELSASSHVSMGIFDIKGVLVHESIDEVMQPGRYTIEWQAKDAPSGVYLTKLIAGNKLFERILIKVDD